MIAVDRKCPYKGSGGKEKLPPGRISTVGKVQKVPLTRTQLSHKHHYHGGVLTMDTPNRMWATPLEGGGQELFILV